MMGDNGNFWDSVLRGYLNPEKLFEYGYVGLKILIVIFAAKIILRLFKGKLSKQELRVQHLPDDSRRKQRIMTLIPLLVSAVSYVVWVIAFIIILQELGINTSALIAGVGVLGIALGFGAQAFVKDVISGFFLLFENLVAAGDTITVDNHTGTVEKIGLRVTYLRKLSGELRIIPNGELTNFGNFNRDFTRAIVPVGLAYEQELDKAIQVLEEVASLWARENGDILLEHPKVQAVTEFGANEIVVRILAKVKPGTHWNAEREIRKLIKNRFDIRNVDIPFPRQVLYLHSQTSRDLEIDLEDLDILPEPGSPEELKDPSLSSMVITREVKRMSGAMSKIRGLMDSKDPSSKKEDTEEGNSE